MLDKLSSNPNNLSVDQVKAIQKANGLTVDGIIGPQTSPYLTSSNNINTNAKIASNVPDTYNIKNINEFFRIFILIFFGFIERQVRMLFKLITKKYRSNTLRESDNLDRLSMQPYIFFLHM
jgi:hypothetical protein